ncbi:MAG: preprotein translocase subunit SecE [Clostridia bacterium]|nr:preprotein translocase subunit SecE [Clostridia bacterium]
MANKDNSEAAKKIAKAEKAKKSGKNANKPSLQVRAKKSFINFFKAIPRFFKNFRGEVKKITWPNAKEVLKSTGVVIFCVAIVGLAVFLVDLGLTSGIDGLRGIAEDRQTTTTVAAEESSTSTTAGTAVDVIDDLQSDPAAN